MVLHPLEFTDCLHDSPYFRENLHTHEAELSRTSKAIKGLIKNCEEAFDCARALSKAQRTFADNLIKFKFECIGTTETDDERAITESCERMGQVLASIEDTRDRLMDKAQEQFIQPLRDFRKKEIDEATEMKRKFDRQSAKFSACVERYCGVSVKKGDGALEDAEAALVAEQRGFLTSSMEYVLTLQRVQEKKKFEFVEILLSLIQGWKTFHHEAYDLTQDFQPFLVDLGHRLQLTRDHFAVNFESAERLMRKLLSERNSVAGAVPRSTETWRKRRSTVGATKEGYLFLMDRKPWGTTWAKHYCAYKKQNKVMTIILYQPGSSRGISSTDTFVVTSCVRRSSDSIEKRWCFDVTSQEKAHQAFTFQALGKQDRDEWLAAMEGKEPDYASFRPTPAKAKDDADAFPRLDEEGRIFVARCVQIVEAHGLENQEGLYRVVGSAARVKKMVHTYFFGAPGVAPHSMETLQKESADVKNVTSALKHFLRSLPEPLLTFDLYSSFVAAARLDSRQQQVDAVADLVQNHLPPLNRQVLALLLRHLVKVSASSDRNLMTRSNLGVCFGPTLLRSEEETMASIMDIKFCNVVAELLIEFSDVVLNSAGNAALDGAAFPSGVRPRPAGRSPVPGRRDKRPAPTPPKRPPKFPPTSPPPAPPPKPTSPPPTPGVGNPFASGEESLSPITDPSNPFYVPPPEAENDYARITPPTSPPPPKADGVSGAVDKSGAAPEDAGSAHSRSSSASSVEVEAIELRFQFDRNNNDNEDSHDDACRAIEDVVDSGAAVTESKTLETTTASTTTTTTKTLSQSSSPRCLTSSIDEGPVYAVVQKVDASQNPSAESPTSSVPKTDNNDNNEEEDEEEEVVLRDAAKRPVATPRRLRPVSAQPRPALPPPPAPVAAVSAASSAAASVADDDEGDYDEAGVVQPNSSSRASPRAPSRLKKPQPQPRHSAVGGVPGDGKEAWVPPLTPRKSKTPEVGGGGGEDDDDVTKENFV